MALRSLFVTAARFQPFSRFRQSVVSRLVQPDYPWDRPHYPLRTGKNKPAADFHCPFWLLGSIRRAEFHFNTAKLDPLATPEHLEARGIPSRMDTFQRQFMHSFPDVVRVQDIALVNHTNRMHDPGWMRGSPLLFQCL